MCIISDKGNRFHASSTENIFIRDLVHGVSGDEDLSVWLGLLSDMETDLSRTCMCADRHLLTHLHV